MLKKKLHSPLEITHYTALQYRALNKLFKYPIDWCFSCAEPTVHGSKKKMFAWIILFLLKSSSETIYYFGFNNAPKIFPKLLLSIDLSSFEENSVISKYLYKKSFWKFLPHLFAVHLDNLNIVPKKVKYKDIKIMKKFHRLTLTFSAEKA